MKTIYIIFFGLAVIFLSSCSPKVTTIIAKNYPALSYDKEVLVIELNQVQPENAEVLGEVKVGDSGVSTNCGYDVVIDKAKMEARKIGGNALKITRHILPSVMASTCHQITATILKIDNVGNYAPLAEEEKPLPALVPADYPHFRIALNGGYSYQLAKISENIPQDFNEYFKGLKSGYHLGGDVNYFFSEALGAGVKYTVFKSQNSLDNVYYTDLDGTVIPGKMSDDLSVTFIGPSFSSRIFNVDKTNALLMSLSIGYLGYKDEKVLVTPARITGNTVGFVFEIGYDIGIAENLALGFQLSLLSGALSQIEWSDDSGTQVIKLESGQYEGLSRIDLSIGLRFIK